MTDRVLEGLRYLASNFGATADEFRQAQHPQGDMLLAGITNNGLAQLRGPMFQLTDAGRKKLTAEMPVEA